MRPQIPVSLTLLCCATIGWIGTPVASSYSPPTTANVIQSSGYSVETHQVQTTDGYILTTFRIPGNATEPASPGKPVVFFQHGSKDSSTGWVLIGAGQALPFLLVDAGYDVWLGNTRGNSYSRDHVLLDRTMDKYWDFSWHEMGMYDLPAMIDYVLEKTNKSTLHYVGHSQGTTTFFVMASMLPEYNSKVASMQALGPVAFMGSTPNFLAKITSPFIEVVQYMMTSIFGIYEYNHNTKATIVGDQAVVTPGGLLGHMLTSPRVNQSVLPILLMRPEGIAFKQFFHYWQLMRYGSFQQFDYGFYSNYQRYGSIFAPRYPLQLVTAPVYLHYAAQDEQSAVSDVIRLANALGNTAGQYAYDPFQHADFLYATNVKSFVYNRIVSLINEHELKQ